jgi:hypothetical protein
VTGHALDLSALIVLLMLRSIVVTNAISRSTRSRSAATCARR